MPSVPHRSAPHPGPLPFSVGGNRINLGLGVVMSSTVGVAWPAANLALFMPVLIDEPTVLSGFGWYNYISVADNIDMGLYSRGWQRITSLGSTARSGTSAPQTAAITPIIVTPGLYYLAVAVAGTGSALARGNVTTPIAQIGGMAEMSTAFPLPATATPTTWTSSTAVPYVWGVTP